MEATHRSSDLPGGESAATHDDLSRRGFLGGAGAALVAAGIATPASTEAATSPTPSADPAPSAPRTPVRLTVNGAEPSREVEARWTLVEVLRDRLALTGTKSGCERGGCGACTVLVDGLPTYSCSTLAVWMEGREARTVEGLARDGDVSTLQRAFMQHNAA